MKLWLLAASVCLLAIAAQADLVSEDTFETIKNTPAEQMVLFYRSSDPDSARIVKMMEKVAKKIKKELPRFGFRKCDGDLPINEKDFKEAAFHKGTFIFTSTPIEGIVKYTGPVDAKALAQHIRHKYLKYDPEDVAQFQDEDSLYEKLDSESKPVFVKFYESWCEHCKRLKEPFSIGATYFKDRVQFMEVECSKNEETTSFCTRNEVRSYPVLMLFTGEDKIQFKEEMRSIMTFEKFFDEHLGKDGSGGKSSESSGDDEEEEVVTKKSKRSKKSSSSDEVDEEKLASKLSKGKDKAAKENKDAENLAELGSFAKPKASDGKSLEDRVAALEATVRDLQDKLRDK